MNKLKELRDKAGVLQTELDEIQAKKEEREDKKYTKEELELSDKKMDELQAVLDEIRAIEIEQKLEKHNTDFRNAGQIIETHNRADEADYSLGEFLIDVARSTTGHGNTPRLDMHQKRNMEALKKEYRATGMSEALPADGGFLVGTDYNQTLLKKVHETGLLMGRTTTIPISGPNNGLSIKTVNETSRATGSRWGGIQVYRLNEGGTKTASKPTFGNIELKLEKLIGLCYATDELLQDAAALETVITQGFGEEFGFRIDDEIIRGTGAGQMLGILNGPCLVTIDKESGQAADSIVKENIDKMWAQLWSKSKPNSVWLINQEIQPQLDNMTLNVGTGGVPVYLPPGGMSAASYGTLKGRPVLEIEQCSALGDVGDIILADLSQYLTIEKGGLQSASSIHVQFVTDETAYRFVMRNNGQPIWNSALTPYKGANDLSPFVTLAERA